MNSIHESAMQKYFLVGEDGKERSFEAADDGHATGLCQKKYAGQAWKLYRVNEGERVEICDGGTDCSSKTQQKLFSLATREPKYDFIYPPTFFGAAMWKLFTYHIALGRAWRQAETVHLSDGSIVHGKIYRSGVGWTLVLSNGATRTLGAADVISIDLDPGTQSGSDLEDQLASLRHSLEFCDNPADAIKRLQNFIQHNPGSAAAQDAQKDIVLWQDRNNRHLIKIGTDWITQKEAQHLRDQTVLIADEARHLMSDGNFPDAAKLVNQIVSVDPHSVPGLYLQGVLSFHINQFCAIRERLPGRQYVFAAPRSHAE